jgi:membrane protease YdiL (CAAX protease family)|nr:MAG: hypothetical protein DIU56_01350 [Pseudomonadota bacterium]
MRRAGKVPCYARFARGPDGRVVYGPLMRTFGWFLLLFLIGFAAVAVLAYPAWALLDPVFDLRFHRVGSRIGMLALAIGFVLLARRMRLSDRASLGYGLPRKSFLRELGIGAVLGIGLMLPVVALMTGLDLRDLREGVTLDAATLAPLVIVGLLRGLAVAFIEETFIRGAMFTGIARESGARRAILLTSLIYAAAHFIGRHRIPDEEVSWTSGLELIAGFLHKFADPAGNADAFLCLFAVGMLLGIVRSLTGNIAACIGLHAGWVFIITFVRETSVPDPAHPLGFLLSRFDGFVGWLVLAWTCLIGAGVCLFYRKRAQAPAGEVRAS